MKNTICFLSIALGLLFNVFAQEANAQEPTKTPLSWTFENQAGVGMAFQSPNAMDLISRGAAYNKTTLRSSFTSKKHHDYNLKIEAVAAMPDDRNLSRTFNAVDFSIARKYGTAEVAATGSYYKSQFVSFSTMGVEVNKAYTHKNPYDKNALTFRPFVKLTWLIPTESGLNFVTPGAFSRTGGELTAEWRGIQFDMTGQFIADTGALRRGKRLLVNIEGGCFFPLQGLLVGPTFGFTRLMNPNTDLIGQKKTRLNLGFAVLVKR